MAKGNRLVEAVVLVVRKFDSGVLVTVVVVAIGALTRGTGEGHVSPSVFTWHILGYRFNHFHLYMSSIANIMYI